MAFSCKDSRDAPWTVTVASSSFAGIPSTLRVRTVAWTFLVWSVGPASAACRKSVTRSCVARVTHIDFELNASPLAVSSDNIQRTGHHCLEDDDYPAACDGVITLALIDVRWRSLHSREGGRHCNICCLGSRWWWGCVNTESLKPPQFIGAAVVLFVSRGQSADGKAHLDTTWSRPSLI